MKEKHDKNAQIGVPPGEVISREEERERLGGKGGRRVLTCLPARVGY